MVYHGPSRGCQQCRGRRVKCDLQEPICRACTRLRLNCSEPREISRDQFCDETAAVARRYQVSDNFSIDQRCGRAQVRPQRQRCRITMDSDAAYDIYCTTTEPSTASGARLVGLQGIIEPFSLSISPQGAAYDPFGAFAFRVDARINQLLNFWQSYLRASMPLARDAFVEDLIRDNWAFVCSRFEDSCQASAFLAVAATLFTTSTASSLTRDVATRYRLLSTTQLRQNLQNIGMSAPVLCSVYTILLAEIAAQNFDAAKVHVRFLGGILQPESGRSPFVHEGQIHAFLWMDMQVAIATLTRPVTTMSHAQRASSDVDYWLLKFPTTKSDLHDRSNSLDLDAIDHPLLRHLFEQLESYAILLSVLSADKIVLSRAEYTRLSTTLLLLSGQLLSIGLELKESLTTTSTHEFHIRDGSNQSLLQAAASMTALYWLRLLSRDEISIHGQQKLGFSERAWTLGPLLLQHMADHMDEYLKATFLPTPSSRKPDAPARLCIWILSFGAYVEHNVLQRHTHTSFHERELDKVLRHHGLLVGAEEHRRILDGFLPFLKHGSLAPEWLHPAYKNFGLIMSSPGQ